MRLIPACIIRQSKPQSPTLVRARVSEWLRLPANLDAKQEVAVTEDRTELRNIRIMLTVLLLAVSVGCTRHSPDNSQEVNRLVDAIMEGDDELAGRLIDSGVGLQRHTDMKGDWSYPIHYAASAGSLKLLRKLVAEGSDPNRLDSYGNSPLMSAGNHLSDTPLVDTIKCIRYLHEEGAEVNYKAAGYFDATALHRQADFSNPELVEVFLAIGADVDARMNGGLVDQNTPLHNASSEYGEDAVRVARLLIEAGADVLAVNGAGLTAREIAEQTKRTEMALFLQEVEVQTTKN